MFVVCYRIVFITYADFIANAKACLLKRNNTMWITEFCFTK